MKRNATMTLVGAIMIGIAVVIIASKVGGWPAFALWLAVAGNNVFFAATYHDEQIAKQQALNEMSEHLQTILQEYDKRQREYVRTVARRSTDIPQKASNDIS